MYRELPEGLPGYVVYKDFLQRIGNDQWSFVHLSARDISKYLAALKQLNPANSRELNDAAKNWMFFSSIEQPGLISRQGNAIIRYQMNGVQMLVLFDVNKKQPKLLAYTLLIGCSGQFELPQISSSTDKELLGMICGGIWNEILKRLPKFNDDYFVVKELRNDSVYFQVWVNPKKGRRQTADVEYCLGSEAFHFKTQVGSIKELHRLIRSFRDGGIPALQESAEHWVQILPDAGQDEW